MQPMNRWAHLWLLAFPIPPATPPPPHRQRPKMASLSYCCQSALLDIFLLLPTLLPTATDVLDVAKTHFCMLLDTKTVENLIFLKPLLLLNANLVFLNSNHVCFCMQIWSSSNHICFWMQTSSLQTMSATGCKPYLLQNHVCYWMQT